jgi:outer membrane protein TolC
VPIRFIFIYLLMSGILFAQESQIFIAFKDLPQLLDLSSPHVKIINATMDFAKAEADAAKQWSNPELNYSFEQVRNGDVTDTEQLAYLSKTFSFPWNYRQESQIWQAETNAAKLTRQQNFNQLLAESRNSYVRLFLLQNLTTQLRKLKEILVEMNAVVRVREEEGVISKLDASLLSLSLFGLDSDILETQQEYQLAMKIWKQFLGIDPFMEVILTDSIEYKNIPIDFSQRQQLIANHPGLQARNIRSDAMDRRITLEKSQILPSISLQGGYKKINPGWEGYIIGLSVPVPLLNWNRPQIEKQKIAHQIQVTESIVYEQKLHSELAYLISSINTKSDLLQKNNYGIQNFKIIEDLLAAYREGEFSLTEFLNAIQLYRDSNKQYAEQLATYYHAIFELEVLNGQQLVFF